jgi:hypothetical protein
MLFNCVIAKKTKRDRRKNQSAQPSLVYFLVQKLVQEVFRRLTRMMMEWFRRIEKETRLFVHLLRSESADRTVWMVEIWGARWPVRRLVFVC